MHSGTFRNIWKRPCKHRLNEKQQPIIFFFIIRTHCRLLHCAKEPVMTFATKTKSRIFSIFRLFCRIMIVGSINWQMPKSPRISLAICRRVIISNSPLSFSARISNIDTRDLPKYKTWFRLSFDCENTKTWHLFWQYVTFSPSGVQKVSKRR